MMRAAVVVNGNEHARHPYADAGTFLEASLRRAGYEAVDVYLDHEASFLLDGIQSMTYQTVAVATHALLHPSIERALDQHCEDLLTFLQRGGGLVLLPQDRGRLPQGLRQRMHLEFEEPEVADLKASVAPDARRDPLLWFPTPTAKKEFTTEDTAPLGGRLLYTRHLIVNDAECMVPIYRTPSDHVLLARTRDRKRERMVVSTLALDWMEEVELVANAMYYARCGTPSTVLIRPPRSDSDVIRPAAALGHVQDAVTVYTSELGEPRAHWLLTTAEHCICVGIGLNDLRATPGVADAVSRGTIFYEPNGGPDVYAVWAGNASSRDRMERLATDFAATPTWGEHTRSLIDRRQMIATHRHLQDALGNSVPPLSQSKLRRLRAAVTSSVQRDSDIRSLLAARDSFRLLDMDEADRADVDEIIAEVLPLGTAMDKARASISDATVGVASANRVLTELASLENRTAAEICRLLDGISVWNDDDLVNAHAADAFVARVEECIGDRAPRELWQSTEAATNVVRGLCVLLPHCREPHPIATEHIARAVTLLESALDHIDESQASLAMRCRIVEALGRSDNVLSTGFKRIIGAMRGQRSHPQTDDAVGRLQGLVEEQRTEIDELRSRAAPAYAWGVTADLLILLWFVALSGVVVHQIATGPGEEVTWAVVSVVAAMAAATLRLGKFLLRRQMLGPLAARAAIWLHDR